ncbi:MAG TPA: cupin domain-containing protein [Gemmatimonadales bacterium]|nr:cupin domain-containing protein [Gemmatimonadales bacterium]
MFRYVQIVRAAIRQSVRALMEHRPPMAFLVLVALTCPAGALAQSPEEVGAILKRFAEDYRVDPTLTEPVVFGVRVDGRWWTVRARPVSAGSPVAVTVSDGKPSERTFFFFLDGETLRKLDAGELNPRTALGKTRHSDPAPMDIDPTHPDVVWDDAFNRRVNAVANHFWIRGTPEFLAFNPGASRVLHGANAVLLHYAQGFRSVWYQIEPGQHINADPGDQVNPFPSLFIFVNGKAKARIGGVETDVERGTATLIPAGVSHEFWNPSEAPFEFILIMFGEGA